MERLIGAFMESRVQLMLTHLFNRDIISFYKMQLLVMSVTLTSWDAPVKSSEGENTALNVLHTLYDDINSPGNSTNLVCVFVFRLGLLYPSLSTADKIKSNQTETSFTMILCVFNDRSRPLCGVTSSAREKLFFISL